MKDKINIFIKVPQDIHKFLRDEKYSSNSKSLEEIILKILRKHYGK